MLIRKLRELGPGLFVARALETLGGRLSFALRKRRLEAAPGKTYPIVVGDTRFTMRFGAHDISGSILERIDGVREPETTSIIKAILKPGDRVLELGGCYGYFTMLMADSVGAAGKVVSVEGLPGNFEILRENIRANEFPNVESYNFFIGSRGDEITFETGAQSPYAGIEDYLSKSDTTNPTLGTIAVKCVNLADFLAEISFAPTHIFMDIEGFEVDAIEQLHEGYLDRHAPTFVFEHHEPFYSAGRGLSHIRELLEEKGYVTRLVYGNMVAFKP